MGKSDFLLGDRIYLNGANHGPFPRVAVEAVREALEWKRDPSLLDDALYFSLPERIREAAAPFFGCDPGQIALTTGASHGINLLARGLDWRPGDRVLVPAGEFPANTLPWYALRDQGVEVDVVGSDNGVTEEELEAAMGPRTRAVAVGHVNFATGYRLDIDALGEACARRGIAYLVDASQSLGAVPLDAGRCGAAVIAAAGYKWICCPYGTGLVYVHPDWVERLPVPVVNWETVEGAEDFNNLTRLELRYRPGARRFDVPETASFLNGMPMAASLEYLGSIGPERIFAHATGLLNRILSNLPEGFRPDSALEPRRRSTILRIVADPPERTREAYRRCVEAGISLSLREGGIRLSPGVWNGPAEISRFLEVLAGC